MKKTAFLYISIIILVIILMIFIISNKSNKKIIDPINPEIKTVLIGETEISIICQQDSDCGYAEKTSFPCYYCPPCDGDFNFENYVAVNFNDFKLKKESLKDQCSEEVLCAQCTLRVRDELQNLPKCINSICTKQFTSPQ